MTQEAITSYDAMGREVSSTDQNTGEVTTTTYDFMGRVVKTERSLTDQEGKDIVQTETKSYNANGSVTSETSSAGVTTEYRYDSRNRVTITKEEADNIARIVGLGALKYFILKVDARKNMTFNPKESIDFNGNTGPFIQYTYARIQSVLRKAKEAGIEIPAQLPAGIELSEK